MMCTRRCLWGLAFPLIALNFGCRHGGIPLINLLGISKPVVIALSTDGPIQALNPFSPYDRLRSALSHDIGHDVALDLCQPFQVVPGMNWGVYHLAIVSPRYFAEQSAGNQLEAVAVPVDEHNRVGRRALLIVKADSAIQKPEDLSGKNVGFGPNDNPRTEYAALSLLENSGVKRSDVAREVLPVPGSLRHYSNPRDLADAIISQKTDAGFIDEIDWEEFAAAPESDRRLAQTDFRVIAATAAIPDYVIVRAPKMDGDMNDRVQRVQQALVEMHRTHPDALRPLNVLGFRRPSAEMIADLVRLAPADARAAPSNSDSAEKAGDSAR
jgi:ABC-type phosphate/phosphonate transport system substrate-binding protein